MKTKSFLSCWPGPWLSVLVLFLSSHFVSASPEDSPAITSVRLEGTNVVVTAQVPPGIQRVTLECRGRLGAGSWEPRALTRLNGSGGEVTFRVPRAPTLEVLRVRADNQEPLPAAFYTGTNLFAGQPVSSGNLSAVFDVGPTALAPIRRLARLRATLSSRTSGRRAATRFTFSTNTAASRSSTSRRRIRQR